MYLAEPSITRMGRRCIPVKGQKFPQLMPRTHFMEHTDSPNHMIMHMIIIPIIIPTGRHFTKFPELPWVTELPLGNRNKEQTCSLAALKGSVWSWHLDTLFEGLTNNLKVAWNFGVHFLHSYDDLNLSGQFPVPMLSTLQSSQYINKYNTGSIAT